MKSLQNNFTTPEQSKRLIELGVPADSADCYYDLIDGEYTPLWRDDRANIFSFSFIKPCWSVGRLIEIAILCTNHYTGDDAMQFKRECLKYGLVECMIVLLFLSNSDGDLDFSKLEE